MRIVPTKEPPGNLEIMPPKMHIVCANIKYAVVKSNIRANAKGRQRDLSSVGNEHLHGFKTLFLSIHQTVISMPMWKKMLSQ